MSSENDERDGKESAAFSEGENKARGEVSAGEKPLPRTPTPAPDAPPITKENLDEPTRNFAAASEAQTALQNAPDTEPTRIFPTDETENAGDEPEIEAADEERDAPDENALRPSRLRYALLCLFFVNMFIYAGINVYQRFSIQSSLPFVTQRQGDGFVIDSVRPEFEGVFQVGDEIVSVNGLELNHYALSVHRFPQD